MHGPGRKSPVNFKAQRFRGKGSIVNEEMAKIPHVVKWGSVPYDLEDKLERFERSEWTYFLKDGENGVLAGYWEAEQGHEDLGEESFHEMLHVIEGKLFVQGADEAEETVAGPGDTIVVVVGRKVRVRVRESVKAFFVCFPVEDVDAYEQSVGKEKPGPDAAP